MEAAPEVVLARPARAARRDACRATSPRWRRATSTQSPGFAQPAAASTGELLPALDASVARARELLGGFDDAAMTATWRLVAGEREIMAMPRVAFVRAIMLNHWYHHRGQLLVYLRLLDVPVPSVYGPTADERTRSQAGDRRRRVHSRRPRPSPCAHAAQLSSLSP